MYTSIHELSNAHFDGRSAILPDDGPYALCVFGAITHGPFATYRQAEKALANMPLIPCGCGCGRNDNPTEIVAI